MEYVILFDLVGGQLTNKVAVFEQLLDQHPNPFKQQELYPWSMAGYGKSHQDHLHHQMPWNGIYSFIHWPSFYSQGHTEGGLQQY